MGLLAVEISMVVAPPRYKDFQPSSRRCREMQSQKPVCATAWLQMCGGCDKPGSCEWCLGRGVQPGVTCVRFSTTLVVAEDGVLVPEHIFGFSDGKERSGDSPRYSPCNRRGGGVNERIPLHTARYILAITTVVCHRPADLSLGRLGGDSWVRGCGLLQAMRTHMQLLWGVLITDRNQRPEQINK